MRSLRGVVWLIVLFSSVCLVETARAQNSDSLETRVQNQLTGYYKKYPQEKLFIHTDEDLYVNGQTIWYKVYSMAYGRPSDLSGIVYIQLSDSAGDVLTRNKLQLVKGTAHGNIDIPGGVHTGWYQLTGFTVWMMNFGKAEYFHQKIYIQNTSEAIAASTELPKKYHLSFFPEGGDPIEGIVSNIAFKAADESGIPVKVDGEVLNSDKKVIAKINTVHDGMGVFSIEGYSGKRNIAVARFPDGTVQTVDLPEFKKNGLAMQVNSLPADAVELKIAFNGDPKQYSKLLLAAYQDNGSFQTYPIQLGRGINVFDIKKALFSTGILRLTLFDQHGVPLVERIVFVNKNDQLKLSLNADVLSANPKGTSVFTFKTAGADEKPAAGNFSVSVTDADAYNESDEDNICSSLLMSSELKGRTYHPAYYFQNNSDTLQQQLDLVMLTSGWRHFRWDKDTVTLKYPVERSQFLAGRIIGYHQPANDKDQLKIKIVITNRDSTKYIGYVTPDSSGRFIMKDFNHSGVSSIYFEVADAKNHKQKLKVEFMKTLMDTARLPKDRLAVTGGTVPAINAEFLSGLKTYLSGNGILLNTIEIKGKKVGPTEQLLKEHVNNFIADQAYTLDLVNNGDGYSNISIINLMQGRFPGLQIYGDDNNASFVYHGGNSLASGHIDHIPHESEVASPGGAFLPYFYLNEQPITFDDMRDIPLPDIALIRFVPPPVWFAPYNGGNVGALLIYTKKQGDDIINFRKEAFDHYTFNGYTITREFASPDYSDPKTKSLTDNRSTLFWNPDLNTNASGEVRFHFYNSDRAKKYRIIIQGMDADGRIGYLNEVF